MSWTLLESQTLSGSQASITLGSGGTLNQGYKTLQMVVSARVAASDVATLAVAFNGSSSNGTVRMLYGTGSAASSGTDTTVYGWTPGNAVTASTFGNASFTFPNYTQASNKPVSIDAVTENNATGAYQFLGAGLWSQTAAITSFTLTSNGGNFLTGTTVTVYGLK